MKDKITYGEKYGKAMDITDPKEARAYFKECVEHQIRIGGYNREQAEAIERQNIGYWSGYFKEDVRQRVRVLYGATHPLLARAGS